MKAIICAVTLVLAVPGPVRAQARPVTAQALTLAEAFERALAANPTIAAARRRTAVDAAGLGVARERLNPEASVEFEKETPRQAYGLAVPLELGGKRAKRIAVGEAAVRSGEAEIAAVIVRVRNDVRRAYYAAVVADARLALLDEARDLAVRVREVAQQRFHAGSAPRLQVMQAELTLASVQNEADAAASGADAARVTLNALLGRPLDTPAVLSGGTDLQAPVAAGAALTLAQAASAELTLLNR